MSLFHVEHLEIAPSEHSPGGISGCSTWNIFVLMEKNGGFCSPNCSLHMEKSIDSRLRRGGVPVFNRVRTKPSLSSDSDSLLAEGLPSPPLSEISLPINIRPRRDVPLVRITKGALNSPWFSVETPSTRIQPDLSLVIILVTTSSITLRLSWHSTTLCMRREYSFLAHCARVA